MYPKLGDFAETIITITVGAAYEYAYCKLYIIAS